MARRDRAQQARESAAPAGREEDPTMTAKPAAVGPADARLLADLVEMLLDVTGEDGSWAAGITAATCLEGDLHLESVELVALGELLRSRYGDGVDLGAFVAELDIDQIIGLTVGDVLAYVAPRRRERARRGDG
jgi:acyl carrier protein